MVRRGLLLALATLLVLSGCTSGEVIDVDEVEQAEPPDREAFLEDAGWPETAAWIARENADGRPVVMNILASWCGPCERELPVLMEAAEANPDIAFLGVDHLDQRESAEAFLEENEVDFPTVFDQGGDVAAAIGGRGMPTTGFFDADGQMVAMQTGELTAATLEERLDEIR